MILLAICTSYVGIDAQSADAETYPASVKEKLKKEFPDNRTVNLVFHGHSVPSGYFRTPTVCAMYAYPQLVLQKVRERYTGAVVNAIVTSIGGEHSDQGAARFDSTVLNHRPDLLFIDYALNDRYIGIDSARVAWESMIRKALAANIKVVLLTPTPDLSENILDDKTPLARHAEQIRKLAETYRVGLADVYAEFKRKAQNGDDIKTYMSQVNHPNERGHAVVAEIVAPWLVDDGNTE